MSVEFIGMIQPRQQSEIHAAQGPAIDPGYLVASAQAHEAHADSGGGFDPLEDAVEYGRELLPITRRLVAERLRASHPIAAE